MPAPRLAAYGGSLPFGELDLLPLHAIMMA